MSVTILVGTQWGDEGKGKIIDVITETAEMVVRFQGGNNAGHTVEFDDSKFVLHLVPSGIFRAGVDCVIGNGVVVDPLALESELRDLEAKGISIDNLFLSDRCHLVMPYHNLMDALREGRRSETRKIGTTKRGIGPAYADKAYRCGIRAFALGDIKLLEESFREQVDSYNELFRFYECEPLDFAAAWERLAAAAAYLAPRVADCVVMVNQAVKSGKKVVFEGAQGAMLDIDHGTYPFVTSSTTTSGGACAGAGLAPGRVDEVLGVMKAYTTRVGAGPMPTESHDELGETLRRIGNEFGATTGRPRRCGWFDAVVARHSCMINGVDKLAVTKMDVMDEFEEIGICVAYEIDGKVTEHIPARSELLEKAKPVYETMPGWRQSTSAARSFGELPEKARAYLQRIAQLADAKIGIVSVGPRREQTFMA